MKYVYKVLICALCLLQGYPAFSENQQVTITQHKHGLWESFFGNGDDEFVCYNKIHRNFYLGLFISIIAMAIILWSRYRVKKKSALALEEKNKVIEERNKDILDSIHYARRIQQAILPRDEQIKTMFSDSFILYKPKDIVSGDFYWASNKGNRTIIAAVDSTGHGVPGALMSMIGNTLLNEIVNEKNITAPAEVLFQLREAIIKSLKQTGSEGENKDGMDIALCMIENKTVHFAGANNPLWIISNGVLSEIKGDKQPIGIYHGVPSPFTNHAVELKSGDCLYLFTDGYSDQFGGSDGKKFKQKKLQAELLLHHHLDMTEQKDKLNTGIENWRNNLEQVDDMLIIGIRV
ncbi:MAG TPA: SpoIIE family protein phosphatase [Bacteroidia bacterium]|jgi:serine phosphatase RsbU (regulator of sigma subunit)|nr:SpoIIE family protein phosphatase [Bacteroidia bacterium]